ncbi:MAG: choice-of-anchor J domain-containing protein, partial [Muribaculaceae bacterium]|nr:choice-of-anchor J domain-containing protein [Muribaculaceae bacterium]
MKTIINHHHMHFHLKQSLVLGCLTALATVAEAVAPQSGNVMRARPDTNRQITIENTADTPADAPSRRPAPGKRPLYGTIVYADSWKDYTRAGVYRVSTSQAEFVPIYTNKDMHAENAVMANGQYWLTYMAPTMFGDFQYASLYNPDTWERTLDKPVSPEFDAAALAWDPVTEKAYGSFRSAGESYFFGTLDLATSKVTQIGVAKNSGLTSMAATPDGMIYATTTDGKFVQVDKFTGNTTTVASTGLVPDYNSGAAIDPTAGCYYFAYAAQTTSALYAINLADGAATKLYDLPENQNILGLWVAQAEAEATAPGTVDNMTVDFTAANLTGSVAFDMPATRYDGAPLTGSMTWALAIDGVAKASGNATAGTHVTTPATVAAKGQHSFPVTVTKDGKTGAPETLSRWIGSDDLYPIDAPTLTNNNGTVTLKWQAPAPKNGGYIDPAAITYTVKRMPDNATVASATKATSFTETLPEPDGVKSVYYTVAVTYEGTTAAAVASNPVKLGYLDVPYNEGFDTAASLDLFTIIDGNGDGYTWKHENKYNSTSNARLEYGSTRHDDWLILPPLKLKKGTYYEISMDVWGQGGAKFEEMEVKAGRQPNAAAMTKVVIPSARYTNTADNKEHLRQFFVPDADGIYFFGIHATTPSQNAYYLHIDNISVAEGIDAVAPAAVSGLTVTPGQYGALEATVRFTAPGTDMAGAPLASLSGVQIFRNDSEQPLTTLPPAPGAPAEWTDTDAPHGNVTYKAVPYVGQAAGEAASASCFVGISKPLQVTGVKLTRGADTGEVKISWDPVTEDINGMGLKADQVTYDVYRIEDEHQRVIASEINTCQTVERVCAPTDPEQFITYQVKAFTRYGSADETDSGIIPVGQPSPIPFVESVPHGHLTNSWAQLVPEENGEYWQNAYDNLAAGVTAADLDGGYLMMNAAYRGMEGTLMSGNISVPADIDNIALSFYYYDYPSQNTIDVLVNDGTGFATIATVTLGGENEAWVRKVIPFATYRGQTLQIAFRGVIANTNLIAIDAVTLASLPDLDLAAREITAPAEVDVNQTFQVAVNVENLGSLRAESYSVELYHDGRLAETAAGGPLAPYAT